MKYAWLAISIALLSTACAQTTVQTLAQAPKTVPAEDRVISENGLTIAYPRGMAEIDAPSTFLIGSLKPRANLTVNGTPVRLNADGYFAHVVPLAYGQNKFVFERSNNDKFTLTVTRKQPAKPLPESPLRIDRASIKPAEDLGLSPGDLVDIAVRATPKSTVTYHLGSRSIKLQPANPRVNLGQNTTYGVTYQNHNTAANDLYTGFYRLQAEDHFNTKPRIAVQKGNLHLEETCENKISVVDQPRIAHTLHDDTIVRFGPSLARTTPLSEGVRLMVDGWQGKNMRCLLAPGKHVFIASEDLEFESGNMPPYSIVRTVNISNEPGNKSDARIVIPLNQRLPYQIEQSITPNKLILKIFGATADTDWIIPTPGSSVNELIDRVSWSQKSDRLYELTVNLKQKRQWGFWASYEDNNLVLHIKSAPKITGSNLNGLTICVDPGHGGSETGSIGPNGTKEGEINFAIAAKLKPLLEEAGVKVIMTRLTEADGPSLQDRVNIAVNNKADLLLSIHNNALPDGRDPWAEHGTSSYYYHPQSMELARIFKDNLIRKLTTFPDRGVFYQNLALCRPSQMPAVLCEVGFMINPDEFSQLEKPQVQDKAAHGLLNGIKEYLLP